MKSIKITLNKPFDGLSLEELLKKWKIPRKERYLLETEKRLTLNQKFLSFRTLLREGDLVTIALKEDEKSTLLFGDKTLVDCLYEDESLIIVNKACGVKTHANFPDEIALQNHVAAFCEQPVFVVHRLDQETSGAVLFAKNTFVLPILGTLLEQRKISRSYLALVKGQFDKKDLVIQKRIGRDRHDSKKRIVSSSGKEAITKVELLENYAQTSLVRCRLETGRTHQIRVHLSSIGRPIIGDSRYGKNNSKEKRLMLHAQRITLTLPFSHELLEISAPSRSFEKRCQEEKENKSQNNRC